MSKYYVCKEVGPHCPVSATTLGYYPNVGVNVFAAAGFGIAAVATLVFGIWKKTYSYAGFIAAGCALELAGGLFFPGPNRVERGMSEGTSSRSSDLEYMGPGERATVSVDLDA